MRRALALLALTPWGLSLGTALPTEDGLGEAFAENFSQIDTLCLFLHP